LGSVTVSIELKILSTFSSILENVGQKVIYPCT
jgi:hypothetical protein